MDISLIKEQVSDLTPKERQLLYAILLLSGEVLDSQTIVDLNDHFDLEKGSQNEKSKKRKAQRWMDDLAQIFNKLDRYEVIKSEQDRAYKLQIVDQAALNFQQILLMVEALLAGRFLAKDDLVQISHALLDQPLKNQRQQNSKKFIEHTLNEKISHYQPVAETVDIEETYQIYQAIMEKAAVEFRYSTPSKKQDSVKKVDPWTIFFNDHYLYLAATEHEEHPNVAYKLYRLDRIFDVKITKNKAYLDNQPQVNYVQSANKGVNEAGPYTVKFNCWHPYNIAIVLDKLPHAKIVKGYTALGQEKDLSQAGLVDAYAFKMGEYATIEAKVYGDQKTDSTKNLMLSLGKDAQVLAPEALAASIKADLKAAYQRYEQ